MRKSGARRTRRFGALTAAVAVAASVGLSAPAADAHDALMRKSDGHAVLVYEPWVMSHWLPFNESDLERELSLAPGQLEAFQYNDHHTLAQLIVQKKIAFEPLVQRLAAASTASEKTSLETIKQRIRMVLVSGHLSQHVMYHVTHGSGSSTFIKKAAGISSKKFNKLRGKGYSYNRLIRMGGKDPVKVRAQIVKYWTDVAALGAANGETPQGQSQVLLNRQLARLRCWLRRPQQALDPGAPYDRDYTKHKPGHSWRTVPNTRSEQAVEDKLIEAGRASRPKSCWKVPAAFKGNPGKPLSREKLRSLAQMPKGWKGPTNRRAHSAMDHSRHEME